MEHAPNPNEGARFRLLRVFDDPALAAGLGRRDRIGPADQRWFPGPGLVDRFARELCARRAVPFRELLEAFEFFALARKHARATTVADLCGGHGLVGALFLAFEGPGFGPVERVQVLDRRRPESFDRVREALGAVRPGAQERLEYVRERLQRADGHLPQECGLVAVHACGERTDRVLDLALARAAPVAVMPCCHRVRGSGAPQALVGALGPHLAVDVHRTYRLEAAGHHVRWAAVPEGITHMGRVLLARPRRGAVEG